MAYRDELTGLQARRAMNEQLMGLGRQYVIAMVDVDHFKRFNDTFGHDVGDQVLKMVATKIEGVKGGGRLSVTAGRNSLFFFPGKKQQMSCRALRTFVRRLPNTSSGCGARNGLKRRKTEKTNEPKRVEILLCRSPSASVLPKAGKA